MAAALLAWLPVIAVGVVAGAFVWLRTGDPIRSVGPLYIGGLLFFAIRQAHDAWEADR